MEEESFTNRANEMTLINKGLKIDGVNVVRLENDLLKMDAAPSVGGRIISVVDKASGHEFLWRNKNLKLRRLKPGSEYDPNFYGGIDELLPNDMPENINGIPCPDHGELWTAELAAGIEGDQLHISGKLPLSGLDYCKILSLEKERPEIKIDYRISNRTKDRKVFLWKLHAAMNISKGDRIICPARLARAADPAWSRCPDDKPFRWPVCGGSDFSVIPDKNGTTEFVFLYELEGNTVTWQSGTRDVEFSYLFDAKVFPCVWYFASYGGMQGIYTAVLEPCTSMPVSVLEAEKSGFCSSLNPSESIVTCVRIYAGKKRKNVY